MEAATSGLDEYTSNHDILHGEPQPGMGSSQAEDLVETRTNSEDPSETESSDKEDVAENPFLL